MISTHVCLKYLKTLAIELISTVKFSYILNKTYDLMNLMLILRRLVYKDNAKLYIFQLQFVSYII